MCNLIAAPKCSTCKYRARVPASPLFGASLSIRSFLRPPFTAEHTWPYTYSDLRLSRESREISNEILLFGSIGHHVSAATKMSRLELSRRGRYESSKISRRNVYYLYRGARLNFASRKSKSRPRRRPLFFSFNRARSLANRLRHKRKREEPSARKSAFSVFN